MPSTEPSVIEIQQQKSLVSTEICPLCDQPIPPEKLVQIQRREREHAEAQARELREKFEAEKAAELACQEEKFREVTAAATEQAQRESTKREAAARAEAKFQAESAMTAKVAEADAARKSAEQATSATTEQLQELQAEHAKAEADFAKREELAATKAKTQAESAMTAKIAEADAAKKSAEQATSATTEQLQKLQVEHAKAEADFAKREELAATKAKTQAESAMTAKIAEADAAKKTAEEQLRTVVAEQQSLADERLQKELAEQRESFERVKTEAVQKEQSKAFLERQKMQADLEKMQRKVRKQRADEIGEEAELDLSDALREAFADDRFRPIEKGMPGADLWQDIVRKGVVCGRIVYDSKNRGAWRNEYVDKLRADQLNAEGDLAVLATRKFPKNTRQLHVQGGVIVAHPARVVALVTVLREQVIQNHRLKLSSLAREAKTAALYDYINSERCNQIFQHHEELMKEMLDMDAAEKKQHDKTWSRRGQLIKKAQRAIQAQLLDEINRIVVDSETP